jgi:ABC-type transport system involved in multi-copper enzyme maturation permease subunit
VTFLPIVERELRVRARLKSTYRFRLAAAALAIGLVGLLLLMAENLVAAGKYGWWIFAALAWSSFVYCLLDGVRNTADCLSEEKRAGTLGLLFLTDLRPYDVVLGKLMATSLNSFYGLLAIFPPLAIPLVIGGVTVGEFWRLVLALINALFFSLAAGMFISAASRDERRAWSGGLGIVLFFAAAPPLLLLSPLWGSSLWAALSPTTCFLNVFDSAYSVTPDRYWRAFWSTHLMSWLWLAAAMFVLPRAWQDRPMADAGSGWRRFRRSDPEKSFATRSLILDSNPIVWLVIRKGTQQAFVWGLVVVSSVIAVAAWLATSGAEPMAVTIFGAMLLVHLTLAVWVASEACHFFAGARDSGAMELLLCTPLPVREIVEGHMLGLGRLFFRPVVALLSVEGLLLGAQVYVMGSAGQPAVLCLAVVLVAGLCFLGAIMDLYAVARYGMWQGLLNRKPGPALRKTVVRVLVLPLVGGLICGWGALWPLLSIIKNLVFLNYAREQLRRQFRALVTDRYGWAQESEFVGQPTKRALVNPLPRVLPR